MNILWIDNNKNEEIQLLIESNFKGKMLPILSVDKALVELSNKPIDLIVTTISHKELLPLFQKVLVKKIIVCLDTLVDFNVPSNVTVLLKTQNFYEDIISTIEKVTDKSRSMAIGDFCPIKTSLLLSVCPLKSDIFIKIAGKFIKIYRKDEVFDSIDFKNITEKKKIEYLFIRKENVKDFINSFVLKQEENKQKTPDSVAEMVSSYSSLYEAVQGFSESLGFNKDIQILAKTQVKSVLHMMGKKPRLNQVLSRLDQFKGEYLGVHSALTGYISSAICSELDWGSEQTYYKLTLAAFLHDIVFTDSRLSMCHSVEEAISLGFSKDKVELFQNHSILSSSLAQTFSEVPPDVDTIILQHHEIPDGTGFPKKLNHNYISPMAAVFFVGHKMAEEIIMVGQNNFNITQFVTNLKKAYPYMKYRKIFEAVEKMK